MPKDYKALSLIEASGGNPNHLLKGALESGVYYADVCSNSLIDVFMTCLNYGFSPSFFMILGLEKGNELLSIGGAASMVGTVVTKEACANTVFVKSILGFCTMAGAFLASLLLLWGLIMCIVGRSNQIKDTPVAMFGKYIVAMLACYCAFDIIWEITLVIQSLWQSFVCSSIGGDSLNIFNGISALKPIISENSTTLLGITLQEVKTAGTTSIMLFSVLSIFLIWKMIKQMFRLIVEIIERYFVFFILLMVFPLTFATCVLNTTKNIFNSYLRMIGSQAFLMLTNMVFLKFFIEVLQHGGWSLGLINYIAGLAYLRTCQRIDQYMLSMGLNVAQTGGGFMSSLGGAFGALKALSIANAGRQNIGLATSVVGAKTGNYDVFKTGAILGATGKNISDSLLKGNAMPGSEKSYNVMRNSLGKGVGIGNNGAEFSTGEDISWLRNTVQKNGMPSHVVDDMKNAGINVNDIERVNQFKDGYGFYDKNGIGVACYYNDKISTNPSLEDELVENNARQDILDNNNAKDASALLELYGLEKPQDRQYLSDDQLKNMFSGAKISERQYGSGIVGHQQADIKWNEYDTEKKTNKRRNTTVHMYDCATHPEMLNNVGKEGWQFVDNNGRTVAVTTDGIGGKKSPKEYKAGYAPKGNDGKNGKKSSTRHTKDSSTDDDFDTPAHRRIDKMPYTDDNGEQFGNIYNIENEPKTEDNPILANACFRPPEEVLEPIYNEFGDIVCCVTSEQYEREGWAERNHAPSYTFGEYHPDEYYINDENVIASRNRQMEKFEAELEGMPDVPPVMPEDY